jgi:hypothetical protein
MPNYNVKEKEKQRRKEKRDGRGVVAENGVEMFG